MNKDFPMTGFIRKHYFQLAFISVFLPGWAVAQAPAGNQPPPAPVVVAEAKRDLFSATLWVSGTRYAWRPQTRTGSLAARYG